MGLKEFAAARAGETAKDVARVRELVKNAAAQVAVAAGILDQLKAAAENHQLDEADPAKQGQMEPCVQTYAGIARDLHEIHGSLRRIHMNHVAQFERHETELLAGGPQ